MYLLWRDGRHGDDGFRDALIASLAEPSLSAQLLGLTLHVDDSDADAPPSSPGMTGRVPFDAMVSAWLRDHLDRSALEAALGRLSSRSAGYLVTESLYCDYGGNRHAPARDWPDGERSPGVVTVTLLEKPDAFDYERWIAHWYGTQSPVSEMMQPRTRYVRNAVVRGLCPHAPVYFGIVEEAWRGRRDMVDPLRFYGAESFAALHENMSAMMRSVTGFLSLPRIQNVTMSEYFLRTPAWEVGEGEPWSD